MNKWRYHEFYVSLYQQLAAAHAKIARTHLIYGRVLHSTALAIEHQHEAQVYSATSRIHLSVMLELQKRDRAKNTN